MGVIITSNCSFKLAIKHLKQRAGKAFFQLKASIYGTHLSPKLKLFDQLIKPILIHGCEIWGIEKFKINNLNDLFDYRDKYMGELLHLSVCR